MCRSTTFCAFIFDSVQRIIQKKSASGSQTLPCLLIFFSKFYFDLKLPKMVFKRGTLVLATAIYQTNCPFTVLSALFCSSGRCPMILDYSLMSIYFMLCDHLAVSITIIYEVMVCPISFDTFIFYLISHIHWREMAFWIIFLRNLLWSISL